MKLTTKIAIVFWTHFFVAVASHIFVVLMFGGVINLLVSAAALSFWDKSLMLGLTFYSGMYAVNHVTNHEGFCFLTDLENFYREQAQLPKVGCFTPRFYAKCAQMWNSLFRKKRC